MEPEQVQLPFAESATKPDFQPKTTTAVKAKPDYRKLFAKRLLELDRSKSPYEKFRDFCALAYYAHAKLMQSDPEKAEVMEAAYMQVVGTYRDKDSVRAFPEMLAWVTLGLAEGGEFLGQVATDMELLDVQNGQFFTPYEVSRLMAGLIIGDPDPVIEEQGYVTLQEPACGAGGMILAAADILQQRGHNPAETMLVEAIDISPLCYHMTYLQLTLRHIPARVVLGNTLSMEFHEHAWTHATVPFYAKHGRLFDKPAKEQDEPNKEEKPLQPLILTSQGEAQQLRLF